MHFYRNVMRVAPLGGTQGLLIGSSGVALVDNATGSCRYFSSTGPSYTSPANDQGTLVQNNDGKRHHWSGACI